MMGLSVSRRVPPRRLRCLGWPGRPHRASYLLKVLIYMMASGGWRGGASNRFDLTAGATTVGR